MNLLAQHDSKSKNISINDISSTTAIKTEDLISTLQSLDMIKVRVFTQYSSISLNAKERMDSHRVYMNSYCDRIYYFTQVWKGQHVIYVKQETIENYMKQK